MTEDAVAGMEAEQEGIIQVLMVSAMINFRNELDNRRDINLHI